MQCHSRMTASSGWQPDQRLHRLGALEGARPPGFLALSNGKALRKVCRQFAVLCRQWNLFADAVVAIDGSKFNATSRRSSGAVSPPRS
jgi:hypothetical protein